MTTLTGEGCQSLLGSSCTHHSESLRQDLTRQRSFCLVAGQVSAQQALSGHSPQGQAWDLGLSRESCRSETGIRLPQHSQRGLSYSPQEGELRTPVLAFGPAPSPPSCPCEKAPQRLCWRPKGKGQAAYPARLFFHLK